MQSHCNYLINLLTHSNKMNTSESGLNPKSSLLMQFVSLPLCSSLVTPQPAY